MSEDEKKKNVSTTTHAPLQARQQLLVQGLKLTSLRPSDQERQWHL